MDDRAQEPGAGLCGENQHRGCICTQIHMLSCVIAAARVLMLMSHYGFAPARLARTHPTRETPGAASLVAGALAFVPAVALARAGVSGAEIYGWMGTLAVYGFLTAYALAAIALPVHLRRHGRLRAGGVLLAASATAAILVGMVGTVYPVPPAPYRYFPYVYVACVTAGMLWYLASRRWVTQTV